MSDIFDEVDEILDEIDSTPSASSEDTSEGNFNESELNDIISEIESLERDFETEQTTKVPIQSSAVVGSNMIDQKNPDVTNVIALNKSTHTLSSSEISFEAHGQMNLNLGFKIGEQIANLTIDPTKGLCVKMNGVELVISDSQGCTVTMESGVKFTIPLTSESSGLKKKVA